MQPDDIYEIQNSDAEKTFQEFNEFEELLRKANENGEKLLCFHIYAGHGVQ